MYRKLEDLEMRSRLTDLLSSESVADDAWNKSSINSGTISHPEELVLNVLMIALPILLRFASRVFLLSSHVGPMSSANSTKMSLSLLDERSSE